ncbi:MAG TPA: hypothetical protein DCQ28_14475 [Bacteroidetes bacterium]|nr:hypothetical protein [Bacteroidota bacterium]
MQKQIRIFLVVVIITLFSCRDSIISSETQSLGKIVFESEYINYVWGYSHNGKYAGEDGKVYSYDLAKSNIQWEDNSDGYYSEDELISKYHHFDTLRSEIPNDTIQWAFNLALLVDPNACSDTTRYGADMGSITNSVYLYRAEKKKFQKIVLDQEGDWRWHNTSEGAIELMRLIRRMEK